MDFPYIFYYLITNSVLYVGRLVERKNLVMLFKALFGTNIHVGLVGDGHFKKSLEISKCSLVISTCELKIKNVLKSSRAPLFNRIKTIKLPVYDD